MFGLPLVAQAPQCDLNGDGVVNVQDVQIVMQAALGAPCGAIHPARDVFTGGAPFSLTFPPILPIPGSSVAMQTAPAPMVYLNGILQAPGTDYAISGQALAFAAADLGDSPVIQVVYWH